MNKEEKSKSQKKNNILVSTRRGFLGQVTLAGSGVVLTPLLEKTRWSALQGDKLPGTENNVEVTLSINKKVHTLEIDPRVTLLDALRENLHMMGTKKGCDHGQCGACTVLVDDRRIKSCLMLAAMCPGKEITTIEGLAQGEDLHPMQEAFIKHDAFQCGYCTPGQVCSAVGLIKEGHAKTDDDIRELMSGNICRCGAYKNIVDAVREVRDNHS